MTKESKVTLMAVTPNLLDVIYTSARTCYNAGTPNDMWDNVNNITVEKKLNLLNKVLGSGHLSVTEHGTFTFALRDISRACTHQLVRHRLCSFSQQSQRYVELKENEQFDYVIPESIARTFDSLPNLATDYQILMKQIKDFYDKAVKQGIKAEDARYVLPNCTKTNIVISCNLRELIHICNERLCTRAQKEIRLLVMDMVKQVKEYPQQDLTWLLRFLVPKCEQFGFCQEHQSCGRKQTLQDMLQKEN